jgi:predicted RNase H-like HicB family nuclease
MTFKRIRRRIEARQAGLVEALRRYTRIMSELLDLTIVYEDDPDSDWIVVSIPEVPGVLSQGKTREEAREMVLSALGDWLRFYVEDLGGGKVKKAPAGADTESVQLTFAA